MSWIRNDQVDVSPIPSSNRWIVTTSAYRFGTRWVTCGAASWAGWKRQSLKLSSTAATSGSDTERRCTTATWLQNVKPADSVNVSRRFCSVSCSVHTTGEGAKPLRKKNCRFGSNSWPRSSGRHRQTDALLIRHMLTFYDRIQLVLCMFTGRVWWFLGIRCYSLFIVFLLPRITHRRQDPKFQAVSM